MGLTQEWWQNMKIFYPLDYFNAILGLIKEEDIVICITTSEDSSSQNQENENIIKPMNFKDTLIITY